MSTVWPVMRKRAKLTLYMNVVEGLVRGWGILMQNIRGGEGVTANMADESAYATSKRKLNKLRKSSIKILKYLSMASISMLAHRRSEMA